MPLLVALIASGTAPVASASLTSTSTTLTVPSGPIELGSKFDMSAIVSPDPGSGVVSFSVDNGGLVLGSVGIGGVATATFPSGLAEGVHTVFAEFSGNGTFAVSSDSRTVTVINSRTPVSVTMTSEPNPSLRGDGVAFHAVVTPNPGGGSLSLQEGTYAPIAQGPLAVDGSVDFVRPLFGSGLHQLRACFGGNTMYRSACSPVFDQVVTSFPSTTSLTITPATVYPDEPITLEITVTPPPETAVNAWVGTNVANQAVWIGIDPATGHGEVTIMTDQVQGPFRLGTHDLRAFFPGTNHVDASASDAIRLTVRIDAATLEVTTGSGPTTVGDPMTFAATVTPIPGEPTAGVGFSVTGPAESGFGDHVGVGLDPDGTGETTVDTDGWPAGDYWYDATFGGDPHLTSVTKRGYFTLMDVEAPEGQLVVAHGADVVITNAVSLDVPATDGVGSGVRVVALSNDGTTWTAMPYAPEVPWNLAAGDGTRTVFAKWRDQAGNWSATVADSIEVRTPAATVSGLTAALESGLRIKSGRVPTRVAWTGAPSAAGILSYRLEVSSDGGAWSLAAAGLVTTSTTRYLMPGHSYRFRVRAVDQLGGYGPWATQTASFRLAAFQQTSSAVSYRGPWSTSSSASFWKGSVKGSTKAGAKATFNVTGRGAAWVSRTGPSRGRATVWVNGKKVATVNLYSATWQNQRIVWRAAWSSTATRTVVIRVSGTTGRPRVDIDGFLGLR